MSVQSIENQIRTTSATIANYRAQISTLEQQIETLLSKQKTI